MDKHRTLDPEVFLVALMDPETRVTVGSTTTNTATLVALHQHTKQPGTPTHEAIRIKVALAENLATPPDTLTLLARDDHRGVRTTVAENPTSSPAALLAVLVSDGNQSLSIRAALAANPNTTAFLLDRLLESLPGEQGVPTLAAASGATLVQIMITQLRHAVVAHPNTSAATLARHADDSDTGVRVGVAAHANTPNKVLARLRADDSQRVRAAANTNPGQQPQPVHALDSPNTPEHP